MAMKFKIILGFFICLFKGKGIYVGFGFDNYLNRWGYYILWKSR